MSERNQIKADYMLGLLTPQQIAVKFKISLRDLQGMAKLGDGTVNRPIPWMRSKLPIAQRATPDRREAQGLITISQLPDSDLHLPPIEACEAVAPEVRDSALSLSPAELTYCNTILRGASPKYAAMMAFEIENPDLAVHRAGELMKLQRVKAYLAAVSDYQCVAVQRDKAWLESVIIKVIDRSLELEQKYDMFGVPMEGKCDYNPGIAIAAAALLSKMKGWDKGDVRSGEESFADKVKRMALQKHRTIEHVTDSEED